MPNTGRARAAADAALATYTSRPGFDQNDTAAAIRDLMVDLAFLSDELKGDEEQSGGYALEEALDVYREETECEGHESLNGADMGATVTCDGSCRRQP
jgi:hypothetical protein